MGRVLLPGKLCQVSREVAHGLPLQKSAERGEPSLSIHSERIRLFFILILVCLVFPFTVQADHIAKGDLDGDGDVDFADFLLFVKNFESPHDQQERVIHTVDTVRVSRVDTFTVYQIVTQTVTETIRDTVFLSVGAKLPRPNIFVNSGGWGMPTSEMQTLLEDIRDVFADRLMYPLESNISVKYGDTGPSVAGHRASDGSYLVTLSSQGYSQTVYQFAHEYGHILSGYVANPPHTKQLWLEESIAVLASLFAIKTLSTTHPSRSIEFQYYYQLLLRDVSVPQNLSQWYQNNKSQLENNPRLWDKNTIVAAALLDIFERYPNDAWNAVKYKDRGTIYYDTDFNIYMNEWYRRTPQRWQFVVAEIMNRFGIPRSSKPAIKHQHAEPAGPPAS